MKKVSARMVIINEVTYSKIMGFLSHFKGLSIEAEEEIVKSFPSLPRDTIRSIISKHGQNILKRLFYNYSDRSKDIVAE